MGVAVARARSIDLREGRVMADYRSPRSGSAAAATAPARLKQEFEDVLWRELPEGGFEIAARRQDHVERLHVSDNGRMRQLATITLPAKGRRRRKVLESHLGRRDEWHEPTDLKGWMPRTSAELAAVEQIADEHNGLALVRDVGGATIDVCAPRARFAAIRMSLRPELTDPVVRVSRVNASCRSSSSSAASFEVD
jgi:hypothetical protein